LKLTSLETRDLVRIAVKFLSYALALLILVAIGFRSWAHLRESEDPLTSMPERGEIFAGIYSQNWGDEGNPTAILLHGTGAWSGLWEETGVALAESGYHAIAIDIPPFGFSDRDQENDYSRTTQAKRLSEFLAELKPSPSAPIMVAHSFGASVGVETVLRYPDLFSGLVVIDGALGIGSTKAPEDAIPAIIKPALIRETVVSLTATNPLLTKRLLASLIHRKDQAEEPYVGILKVPSTRKGNTKAMAAWLPWLLAAHPNDLSIKPEAYAAWKGPTEVIWGDKDTVTPIDQGRELVSLLSQSKLTVLEDVGHIPQIEDPAGFQSALIDALNRISGQ